MKKWETYGDVEHRLHAKPRVWWRKVFDFIGITCLIYFLAGMSYAWALQAVGFSVLVSWIIIGFLVVPFSYSVSDFEN